MSDDELRRLRKVEEDAYAEIVRLNHGHPTPEQRRDAYTRYQAAQVNRQQFEARAKPAESTTNTLEDQASRIAAARAESR